MNGGPLAFLPPVLKWGKRGGLMEIVFIRHGQGEHNLPVPDRLNMAHPRLTAEGRRQVSLLRGLFAFSDRELLIVSPTVRTIETANLLTEGSSGPGNSSLR